MTFRISALPQTEMQRAVQHLDQALSAHNQWLEAINATLICRLTPDRREIEPNAHEQCRFGQWVYGPGGEALGEHPGFAAIEAEHKRLHEMAAALLRRSDAGEAIVLADYENFLAALKRVRLEVDGLRHELEIALHSLDPLTGVPGRAGLIPALREQQAMVERGVQACTVAIFDLDHFKAVNDTYGHQTGDAVLVRFAQYVRDNLRPYDKLFRYGGEEFLICAPQTGEEEARQLADRLRLGLAGIAFEASGAKPFHVTVSMGLAALAPDVSVEKAIERADKALYAAKAAGRDCTMAWEPSMA